MPGSLYNSLGIGGPSSGSAATQLNQMGVTGPAQANLDQEQQDAAQQQQLLALLTGQAAGTGPSAAQAQLSAGLQQSMAAQQAAAAGGRYGQNAQLRQQGAAAAGASLEAGGANQAAQLRAQQMAQGAQAAGAVGGQITGQALQAAGMQQAGQQAYNQEVAGLGGAEEGQQSAAGQSLLGGVTALPGQAISGVTKLASMAHGGVSPGRRGLSLIGEEGPEAVLGINSGEKKVVTHPQLTKLGVKEPQVVVPLKDGSAPYKPGAMPSKVTAPPSKDAPKGAEAAPEKLSPEAAQAIARLLSELKGSGPHAMADGGVEIQDPADTDETRKYLKTAQSHQSNADAGVDLLNAEQNPRPSKPQARMAGGGVIGMNAPVSKADILKMLLQHVTGG